MFTFWCFISSFYLHLGLQVMDFRLCCWGVPRVFLAFAFLLKCFGYNAQPFLVLHHPLDHLMLNASVGELVTAMASPFGSLWAAIFGRSSTLNWLQNIIFFSSIIASSTFCIPLHGSTYILVESIGTSWWPHRIHLTRTHYGEVSLASALLHLFDLHTIYHHHLRLWLILRGAPWLWTIQDMRTIRWILPIALRKLRDVFISINLPLLNSPIIFMTCFASGW